MGVARMKRPPPLASSSRLALEYSPASPTNRTRPSRIVRRSSLIVCTVVTSGVLPGNTQERTGTPSRVTARAITTCGSLSRPSLLCPRLRKGSKVSPRHAVPALAQRLEGEPAPLLAGDVLLVTLEPGRGAVIEDQVDVELEQIDRPPEHRLLDGIAVQGQDVQGAVELVKAEVTRLGELRSMLVDEVQAAACSSAAC